MATKDLVADYGGVGDGQRTSVTGSITSGASPVFTPASDIFAATGDPTGKAIYLVSSATSFFYPTNLTVVTISAYNAGTGAVTLSGTNATAKTDVTFDVLWGTDDSAAFMSFKTFAATQGSTQTQLTIPAGRYCVSLHSFQLLTQGTQNVLFSGPLGARETCIISQLVATEVKLGGTLPIRGGLGEVTGASARLQTCTRGSTTATLVDKTNYGALLTSGVGGYCFVTAFDRQSRNASSYGYPPNPHFYETNIITAYDSGTGVITFQNPLSNTYKSTYPEWYNGDASSADPGGPATIYILTDYDRVVEFNDISIDSPHHQIACPGREVIIRRCIVPGWYPTQNTTFSAYDTSWSGTEIEVDKIVGTTLYDGCDIGILKHQSASPNICTVQNGCTIGQIVGTPKKIYISDSEIPVLQIGTTTFGRTDEVSVSDVTGLTTISIAQTGTDGIHGGGVSATMPITDGLFSFLKTDNDGAGGEENPTRGMVPGTWLIADNKLIFQITDVYEDGTYCYVQTSLTGSWPFTVTALRTHPAPIFTMRNCTGTAPQLEDLNQAPARSPLFSYSKRTLVAGATATTPPGIDDRPRLHGRFVSESINVTTPYVGAGTLFFSDHQHLNRQYMKLSDYTTATDFGSGVNMKIAGERVIRAATTATGAQSLDTLEDMTAEGEVNFTASANSSTVFSANVTNGETPTVTVEYIMDQGIPPPVPLAVVPLRFRLRAV